jgi:hypothetical protein
MKLRVGPARRRCGDKAGSGGEPRGVAAAGGQPLGDALVERRRLVEHRRKLRPLVTAGGGDRHPEPVERKHVPAAAGMLHLLFDDVDDREHHRQRLARRRLRSAADHVVDRFR